MVTLFIDIPHDESVLRLLKRAELEQRIDDTAEGIEFRLQQYYHDTVPVLDYLRPLTTFIHIDGSPAVEHVTASIDKALGL